MPASRILSLPPALVGLTSGDVDKVVPGTGRSGPGGVESIIQYRDSFFNVRSWLDTYLITQIEGLADADVRDAREVNPGAHGETAFDAFYGGRTISLQGRIRAQSLSKLRDMQQGLREVFADISVERPLIFRTGNAALDLMIYCRKNQAIQSTEVQNNFLFERDFMVTLRASNPRFVSLLDVTTDFPLPIGTTIGNILVNNGNFQAQPVIRLYGPMNAPITIINDANGQRMQINAPASGNPAIITGRYFEIDTGQRTVKEYDTVGTFIANRFDRFDFQSDWLELEPGNNYITLTIAGAAGVTTSMSTRHKHTYM